MRASLDNSSVYRFFYKITGAQRAHYLYVQKYVKPSKGNKILDVGCGPADIIAYLPDVFYTGFDMNKRYIEEAIRRYGDRAKFFCEKINKNLIKELSAFDIVIASGVLHHLNDEEAKELFELSFLVLKEGGRLVTLDGCYVKGQSKLAKYLLSKDRGSYVRKEEEYLKLASKVFLNIKTDMRNDLLFIPYTHIILQCNK